MLPRGYKPDPGREAANRRQTLVDYVLAKVSRKLGRRVRARGQLTDGGWVWISIEGVQLDDESGRVLFPSVEDYLDAPTEKEHDRLTAEILRRVQEQVERLIN